jgi:hypothetical protein
MTRSSRHNAIHWSVIKPLSFLGIVSGGLMSAVSATFPIGPIVFLASVTTMIGSMVLLKHMALPQHPRLEPADFIVLRDVDASVAEEWRAKNADGAIIVHRP